MSDNFSIDSEPEIVNFDEDNELNEITGELASAKRELRPQNEGHLTIDVFQTEDNVVIQSAIAGVNPENIDISVSKDTITIKGHRETEQKVKTSDYYHQELYWGRFSRTVILPVDVDADKARASYKNGVLTVFLPKLHKGLKK